MEQDNKPQNVVVETYAEDMAEVIGSDTEGLVKKIIQGEEEHEKEKKNLSPESKQNKIFMLVGALLIIIALGTLSFFILTTKVETVMVEKQFTPLIFNDKSVYPEIVGLKNDEIAQTVLSEINTTSVKARGVEGIYLTENKKIIGLRRFLVLTKSNFIPGGNTAFVSDSFLLGVVKGQASTDNSAGNGFFLLLKVRGTADVFDSMHNWEAKMFSDLHGFLGVSITADTNYLLTKNFEDGIIENKNARILYDKGGKIILMYIFVDENSVVITNSQDTAHEIVLRLASSQTTQ
jgi:hypothetical protein